MGSSADGPRNGVRANGTRALRNPDELAPGCVRLLEEGGFTYDRQIGAWLNRPAGRVIAFDRVANRSSEWLAAWLGLSRAHPLFIANGHDVRTMRFGRPRLVLVRSARLSDQVTPATRERAASPAIPSISPRRAP
jgi:hypothetical protein